ncbi:MAG: energy transducer TonB [Pyrinomonadaceae bacterium]
MRVTLLILLLFTLSVSLIGQTAPVGERISVPDINGLAVTLVKPAFPAGAATVGADGAAVSLRVVVDESGNVISAVCSLSCHPMLKDAAELAASTSKFKPQMQNGRPVKYEGILLYTFVVSAVNWARFGTAIESTIQFDNISLGPVAQILSGDFAAEKTKLLTLDEPGVTFETRQKVMAEVIAAIKTKLGKADRWRFETSMALRRITFWTMAGAKTDRAAMQKALDELPTYAASAPDDVSALVLSGIATLAKYRVTAEIDERELRREIGELSRKIPHDLK